MSKESKTCTNCGETKPTSEFYKRGDSTGYVSQCKECRRAKDRKRDATPERKAYFRARESRPERKAYKKEQDKKRWEGYSGEKRRARLDQIAKWRKQNPAKVRQYLRKVHLDKTYGISEVKYQQYLRRQNGICAICGRPPVRKRLAIDHDPVEPVFKPFFDIPILRIIGKM